MKTKTVVDFFNENYLNMLCTMNYNFEEIDDLKIEISTENKKAVVEITHSSRVYGIAPNHFSNYIDYNFESKLSRFSTNYKIFSKMFIDLLKDKEIAESEKTKLINILVVFGGYVSSLWHLAYTIENDLNILSDTRQFNVVKFREKNIHDFFNDNIDILIHDLRNSNLIKQL